jgi:hypothetical protein
MRRSLLTSVVVLVALVPLTLVSPSGAATSPFCGIHWGSLAKVDARHTVAPLGGVRAGRHACFDRLVLDLAGPAGGYHVGYRPEIRFDGSGQLVPLLGGAFLEVIAHAPAYDAAGNPTFDPATLPSVTGFATFRQVAWAGSFEGQTTIGLGVRARLPFRVFLLAGPGAGSRMVIDVAHRW